ncbi:MAG: transposase [Kiritimatiellia bacterium]
MPGSADVLVGTAVSKADVSGLADVPGSADVPVGTAVSKADVSGLADVPGSADVPVGTAEDKADMHVGVPRTANGNIGAPRGANTRRRANEDVGAPRPANEDVGAPRDVGTPEWHSRGYLPHRDHLHLIQSITFRLVDSLPQTKLNQLEEELKRLPKEARELESRKRIEEWLDAGMGCCALRHPEVARYVQNSFLHFHGEHYHLHAWCIMPNHVHILVEPLTNLAGIIQGWKSYTARWVLRQNHCLQLRIPGPKRLWMREYWDRYIRNFEHYQKAVNYIHRNPVIAGLCQSPEDWPWSSAKLVCARTLGSTVPGSADVLVGIAENKADEDVGVPRLANEDVGAPRDGVPMTTKVLLPIE